jgi:hypothetical protein
MKYDNILLDLHRQPCSKVSFTKLPNLYNELKDDGVYKYREVHYKQACEQVEM